MRRMQRGGMDHDIHATHEIGDQTDVCNVAQLRRPLARPHIQPGHFMLRRELPRDLRAKLPGTAGHENTHALPSCPLTYGHMRFIVRPGWASMPSALTEQHPSANWSSRIQQSRGTIR